MSGRSNRPPEQGFSLVEVLCALAIAAAAIVVLMRGTGLSLTGARALDMRMGARVLLVSIIEDELSNVTSLPEEREGESGPYHWRLSIVAEDGPEKLQHPYRMFRLVASASWAKGGSMTATAVKLAQ